MIRRGLIQGILMLIAGAAITWGIAGALQDRAAAGAVAAGPESPLGVATSKVPASRWMF